MRAALMCISIIFSNFSGLQDKRLFERNFAHSVIMRKSPKDIGPLLSPNIRISSVKQLSPSFCSEIIQIDCSELTRQCR